MLINHLSKSLNNKKKLTKTTIMLLCLVLGVSLGTKNKIFFGLRHILKKINKTQKKNTKINNYLYFFGAIIYVNFKFLLWIKCNSIKFEYLLQILYFIYK